MHARLTDFPYLLETIVNSKMPTLVGIDGRACSGKTTLATQLFLSLKCSRSTIRLDDFLTCIPGITGEPLAKDSDEFIRHAQFLEAIRSLANGISFTLQPFDWRSGRVSTDSKTIVPADVVLIEGVSALSEEIIDAIRVRVFVVSDKHSQKEAYLRRNGPHFQFFWEHFLAPVETRYFKTCPWERAEFLFVGRGVPLAANVEDYL